MKFFISKNKKLPSVAQKGLLPREEFMTQGKERFLAAFDASALPQSAHLAAARPAYVNMFFKIGVGALAVLAIGVGLSAYADTANVSATNPLYPLKRLGENVQLAFTSSAERPQLQATFAVRRANEIAALEVSAPTSTLIPKLTSDLDQDIDTSLSALIITSTSSSNSNGVVAGVAGGVRATSSVSSSVLASPMMSPAVDAAPIDVYCDAFKVSTSGVLIGQLEASLATRPNGFADFNEQCDDHARDRATFTGATYNDQHPYQHSPQPVGGYIVNASTTTTGSVSSASAPPFPATTTIPTTPTTTKASGVTSIVTVTVVASSTAGIHVNIPKISP